MVLADLADIALPPILPAAWIKLCKKYGFELKRGGWTDRPERTEYETIRKVKELVFPTFGLE
jgi:hypothetical protein